MKVSLLFGDTKMIFNISVNFFMTFAFFTIESNIGNQASFPSPVLPPSTTHFVHTESSTVSDINLGRLFVLKSLQSSARVIVSASSFN